MKKYFSKKLYIEGLKQLRLHGIFLTFVSMAIGAIAPFWILIDSYSYERIRAYTPLNAVWINVAMMYILPIVFAFGLFSFIMKRKHCDFYHALPVKRECLFTSFALAGATWIAVSMLLANLFTSALLTMSSTTYFSFSGNLLLYLNTMVGAIAIFGALAFAMSITGQKFTALVLGSLIIILPRLIIYFFQLGIDNVYNGGWTSLELFSPMTFISQMVYYSRNPALYTKIGSTVYTLVIAIGLLVLACWAFTKRKSELAGNSSQNKYIQYAFQAVICCPILLFVASGIAGKYDSGRFFEASNMMMYAVMIFVSLLIFITVEILTKRSGKNIIKSLPVFCIVLALTACFTGSMIVVNRHIYNNSFIAVEDMTYVKIDDNFLNGYLPHDFVEEIEKHKFTDDEIKEIISIRIENTYDRFSTRVEIGKSFGRSTNREVKLYTVDVATISEIVNDLTEYDDLRYQIPEQENIISLKPLKVYRQNGNSFGDAYSDSELGNDYEILRDTFYSEYNALNEDERKELLQTAVVSGNGAYAAENTSTTRVRIQEYDDYLIRDYIIEVTPLMPKTFDMMVKYQNEINEKELSDLKWHQKKVQGDLAVSVSFECINEKIVIDAVDSDEVSPKKETEQVSMLGSDTLVPELSSSTFGEMSKITEDDLQVILEILKSGMDRDVDPDGYVEYTISVNVSDKREGDENSRRYTFQGFATFTPQEVAEIFSKLDK